ncbi:hypothetical protein ACFL27_16955 [candidate division CSSED10-310 bacterium]|uniref:DUF2207 domain-containing protein n=1 Tax=candidate division CSSED10-310 bacterium TaxID=2855610 RepID=A0ABV6Z0B9_UNCC1
MAVHEIKLGVSEKSSLEDSIVYVVPRSPDPYDYALISPLREKDLLRKGIEGPLEFQGYAPILEKVEAKVKEFLHNKIMKRYRRNLAVRRVFRWGSALGILSCFLFFFSGFFDDMLCDPLFLFIIGYTFYREYREQRNLEYIQSKIDSIKFVENPLLTAIYNNFKNLETPDYRALEWSSVQSEMKSHQVDQTFAAITEYLGYKDKKRWQSRVNYLTAPNVENNYFTHMLLKLISQFYQRKLAKYYDDIKHRKRLKAGYYDIYEHLLESRTSKSDNVTVSR